MISHSDGESGLEARMERLRDEGGGCDWAGCPLRDNCMRYVREWTGAVPPDAGPYQVADGSIHCPAFVEAWPSRLGLGR